MAVNVCKERILQLQEEYPFLREIGFSLKKAKSYLSKLNIQIRQEKEKNKQLELNRLKEKKKQKKQRLSKKRRKHYHTPKEIEVVNQTLIENLKAQKKVLINYLRYLNRYHQIEYQMKLEQNQENIDALTDKQQLLLIAAMNNQFDNFRLCDFYTIYIHALGIEEYQTILTNLVNELQDRYQKGNEEVKEEIAMYFGKMRQQTTSHLLKLEEKSAFLKELAKTLYHYRRFHTITTLPVEQVYDPLEDYLKLLLNSENSYDYLEKIVYHKLPNRDIVNFKDSKGNHIVFYIQELLFNSCMLELINQTKDYIKKEHYQKIWKLFMNHPHLELTEEEKQRLHLNEVAFIESIQKRNYKKGPMIQQFIYNLSKQNTQNSIPCPEDFSPYYYGNYQDLTHDYTFALAETKKSHIDKAYSVTMTEQGTFLVKVHIVDVSATILEDTPLDTYLKEKMFKVEDFIPDKVSIPYIYLQQDDKKDRPYLQEILASKKRPVITYEIEVNGKGRILKSDVYKSMVIVDRVISYDDINLQALKRDDQLYPVCYLYYSAHDGKEGNTGKKLENVILSFVKKMVGDYLAKSNLPMIYSVQDKRNDAVYAEYMKDSSYIFGKMDMEEAHLFHSILREDVNYAHLGLENIGHFEQQDTFCIRLFNPCSSYIDIVIQRLVKLYFCNKEQTIDKEEIEKVLLDIVMRGNEKLQDIRTECKMKKLGQLEKN